MGSRKDSRPQGFNGSKLEGCDVEEKPEVLCTGAMKEEMSSVLNGTTEVTKARVICSSRAQPRVSVKFVLMDKPEEGTTAGGREIMPNEGGKSIVRQMGEG